MEICKKFSNIIKRISSELRYTKKYLVAKKPFNAKESFQCLYRKAIPVPVILIDSIYRKDENYNPKVFLFKISFILMIKTIVMILMKKFQ